jgi:hypothetical protein
VLLGSGRIYVGLEEGKAEGVGHICKYSFSRKDQESPYIVYFTTLSISGPYFIICIPERKLSTDKNYRIEKLMFKTRQIFVLF